MTIKVLVNGAHGRMGKETVTAIQNDPDLKLVAGLGREDDLKKSLKSLKPDVVVDFTHPDAVKRNTDIILEEGIRPVIGTSGLKTNEVDQVIQKSSDLKIGGIIAPNFALGAVLLMKYAADIAQYFPQVEIIEMHHDGKVDAPSGTAIRTADLIAQNKIASKLKPSRDILPGSRGADYKGIAIHAVRLPGIVAQLHVIFGGKGETLTLRHDSIDRTSFMPGVILACKKVISLNKLVVGLENLL